VKLHRAVMLVAMMVLGVALLVAMVAGAVASWDARSALALAVVIVVAAIGGVGFSWRRYFGKKA
jgi:hypothetical protein